ncbi:MAG: amylo-alpha-1,6-glucosidase, partial [Tepidisphaeraceae bacterium]
MSAVNLSRMSLDDLCAREWLAVNHVGGFACSTIAGLNTRKYHGLLVAAMTPPVRRMVLLSRVEETVRQRGANFSLSCSEYPGTIHPQGHTLLRAFSPEPFPRWGYQGDGWTIQKELRLLRGENTACLTYTLLGATEPVELEVRPLFALRGIHELMYQSNAPLDPTPAVTADCYRIPPTARTPEVFFAHDGLLDGSALWYLNTIYRREIERGYAGLEDLYSPGVVRYIMRPGQSAHFVCATEPIDLDRTVAESERAARNSMETGVPPQSDRSLALLTRAADQFIAPPNVVTDYPWSAPSIRDALIGFEGLFLSTCRFEEGLGFLKSCVSLLRNGLLPGEIPEDGSAPRYDGADISLWLVNAVFQYTQLRTDEGALADSVAHVIDRYRAEPGLGIRVDTQGLLHTAAGATWMNACVDGAPVTPRAGRTVEINALWYNALKIAAELCNSAQCDQLARQTKSAFNDRFWNASGACCFDVLADDAPDGSIRPNQLLAAALPFAVLDESRIESVLRCVEEHLLTPMGIRTLSPSDPQYQGRYRGDAHSRDRALHQGSVFPWLLGPYLSCTARARGDAPAQRDRALESLRGCLIHLEGTGVGQLSELFDADAPHRAGGAIASARSVGQVLSSYARHALGT